MIFYYSNTGNSRWVAEQLAELCADNIYDITTLLKANKYPTGVESEPAVVVVFPIHSWSAPEAVVRFLKRFPRSKAECNDGKLFLVCTCGDDAGKATSILFRHSPFKKYMAWSVQMPNTYVPMFNLDSDELCRQKITRARERVRQIACMISKWKSHQEDANHSNHEQWDCTSCDVVEGSFAWIKSYIIKPLFYKFCVSSNGFHLEGKCSGCGICQKSCPAGNIALKNGEPTWGGQCIHCMACYHACPQNIIQYKQTTQKKGQYKLKKYL